MSNNSSSCRCSPETKEGLNKIKTKYKLRSDNEVLELLTEIFNRTPELIIKESYKTIRKNKECG